MLTKRPPRNPNIWTRVGKYFGILAVIEIGGAYLTYLGFNKIHSSSETRLYLSSNYPLILDGYYYVTDKIGGNNFREQDLVTWSVNKISWKE